MTYKETINYLYSAAPLFQNVGQHAYKPGLCTSHTLDDHFGHPHQSFLTIHVAGTNGKGSVSHSLASILQEAGYRVGLYTSPHIRDFRERIRVNGEMISEQRVIDFIEAERSFFEPLHPSFFELTTALAFLYFQEQYVDVAVIEVGLGGRLDCTNIITPCFCIITNISFDHTQLLGDTLVEIAGEKAGIIKPHVPVVIGETTEDTRRVFQQQAERCLAPISYAEDFLIEDSVFGHYQALFALKGAYQFRNLRTILSTFPLLENYFPKVDDSAEILGLQNVLTNTHLEGRWQTLKESPLVVCDTGHNPAAFQYLGAKLAELQSEQHPLHVVFGMVNDKDIRGVLSQLPATASYYFCQPSVKRALSVSNLQHLALDYHLQGKAYSSVRDAYKDALLHAEPQDTIFVGGSTYIVSDLFCLLDEENNKGVPI